jgi:hypothetical protein
MIFELLKEYVSLFEKRDAEAEKKLLKHMKAGDVIADDEQMLLNHGITPIGFRTGEEDFLGRSFLAHGSYVHVYEVSYKGKRAVAKVSFEEQDIKMIKMLSDLRAQLPKELAKHLPKVYTTFFDDEYQQHVAVVEFLQPLNAHLQSLLFSIGKKFPSQLTGLLKNKKYVASFIEPTISDFRRDVSNETLGELVNAVTDYVANFEGKKFDKQQLLNIKKDLKRIVATIIIDKQPDLATSSEPSTIATAIYQTLNMFLKNKVFPSSHFAGQELQMSREMPGVETLVKVLEILKDKFSIYWSDMHEDNMMQRPGTDDVVIADPGLFDVRGEVIAKVTKTEGKLPVGDMHFHKPGNVPEPSMRPSVKKHLKKLNTKGFDVKVETDKTEVATSKNLMLDEPGTIVEPDVRKAIKNYFKKMKLSK